ncbi:MAG: ATP-binding protein [Oscillospiraceae bacterium]
MEEQINKRLFFIGILSLVLATIMTTAVFQRTYDSQVKSDLRMSAELIVSVFEKSGGQLELMGGDDIRITHIDRQGRVLYESMADCDTMENHIERPEVLSAIKNGTGEDIRKSSTFGYSTFYYAIKLTDGSVLRVSRDVKSMYSSFDRMLLIITLLAFAILVISVVLSVYLTKQLVRPIEDMARNLDEIDENVPYHELEPFALKIKEQQLRKRENDRLRQEFTANVSHELKTPLTSISGYAEMIENGMAKPEDVNDFAGKIHNEAGRLISLIGDILKLGEIEEQSDIKKERVNLSEISAEIVDSLAFSAERAGVRLEAVGESCYVTGDRDMLAEMVFNLCDNAIRYNSADGSVLVRTESDGKNVMLSVEDTGIGIPKEHQSRIFERFYRVDKSRSKQTGGTGLGLAIVKHIALKHGASISIISNFGEGTRVIVEFPNSICHEQA